MLSPHPLSLLLSTAMHACTAPVPLPRMLHTSHKSTYSQQRKVTPVPAPRSTPYPAWSHRDNGHSPVLIYRSDFTSADNVDENTSMFHHAYHRDTDREQLGIRRLVQTSDPCIPESVQAARPTQPYFPLFGGIVHSAAQRSVSDHIRPIVDMFERKRAEQDTTTSSLDDSNKENMSRDSQKSPEKQLKLKRKAVQGKPSFFSQLRFLPFKTRKIQQVGPESKSETECNLGFTPRSKQMQVDDGECKSVPVLHSKASRKELMEDRQPLRPIALHDINDTDPEGCPYMSPSDYRSCTPEYELEDDDKEDYVEDLPPQSRHRLEQARDDEDTSTKKPEQKLSPFVSSLADKYGLTDWKDRRWKKYVNIEHGMVSPVYIGGKGNLSNNALQDEMSTCSMFFEKTSPEKTQSTKSVIVDKQRVTKSAENLQRSERMSDSVRESVSSLGDSWRSGEGDPRGEEYRKKKFPTTFVTAAEVYRHFRPEKSIIQGECAAKPKIPKEKVEGKGPELSDVQCPEYLRETFSGACAAAEEDSLSKSLGDLERFLCKNVADLSACDEHNESPCHSPSNPWMSPPPKYDLGHRVRNAHFDEHLIHKYESLSQKNLTEQEVLAELDSKLNAYCNVETQTSDTETEMDVASAVNRRNVSTSPMLEMVSYEPSLDHSDCDTPQMTPGKRSTKPRYSSSPIARAEQFGDYDIEGTPENGLNFEVVGKKLKVLGDDINSRLESDYDIVGTEENGMNIEVVGTKVRLYTPEEQDKRRIRLKEDCSERRKRRFSWKRLFQPKNSEAVKLLSYRRTEETESPVEEKCNAMERMSPVKEAIKTKLDDVDETVVNVEFKPEDISGTVEAVFCHDYHEDELSRGSSFVGMNWSTTKIQSQSNESQTSQRLVPKESPAACNLVKYSMEDIVKELEEEGRRIEKEFLRIVTDNTYDFLEDECKFKNPHSLMYLAGMACSKRYQLMYNSDILDEGDEGASYEKFQDDRDYDLVCGRRRIDFMRDDFYESSHNEDTGGEEMDQDICPDSPGLIASMTRDVQGLNLAASPNSSDADIARRIDSFLRDALKPIDDLVLRNDTSDDDLGEEEMENFSKIESSLTSQRDERVPSYTPYNSPCVTGEPRFSVGEEEGGEEEECSALNKSFSTEDSDMDSSIREALKEVEGVTPVMLDHQLQETESDESDEKFNKNVEENDGNDEDNTNNNFFINDVNNNSGESLRVRIGRRYPRFCFFSPLDEDEDDSNMSPTHSSEENPARESNSGHTLQPSKSDTRSLDTTGSDKFYTDVDTSLDTSRDTAKFYTDRDTDLDSTVEDRSFGALRRSVRSSGSPASEGHGVVSWSMDDSIEV